MSSTNRPLTVLPSSAPPPHPLTLPPSPPQSTLLPTATRPIDLEAATPAPTTPNRYHACCPGFYNSPPFKTFLRRNWYDIMTQIICLGIAGLLYKFVHPIMPHHFPFYHGVEHSAWGMKHSKPYIHEYVDTIISAIVSFAVPALVMGSIALWGTRRFEDGNAALIGLGYALSTSTLFILLIKIFIGGLRPHFLTMCAPRIPPATPHLASIGQVRYYTASQICTAPRSAIKEAQMSFPSGHASAAFAGFGFLALYLNAHFKILSPGMRFRDMHHTRAHAPTILPPTPGLNPPSTSLAAPSTSTAHPTATTTAQPTTPPPFPSQHSHHWKLILFALPWLIAVLLAASKVRDHWHHPVDVVFGAIVGTLFALAAYKMCYRSVWNPRDNHVPLGDGEAEGKNAAGVKEE